MAIYNCLFCNDEFKSFPSECRKFCSHRCYSNNNKGNKRDFMTDEIRKKISKTHKKIGKTFESRKGKTPWNKGKAFMRKEQNPNWKGGVSTQNHIDRTSGKFKEWRDKVFHRDKWICQWCRVNGDMQAHHIRVWREYKELRYEVSNGITLCPNCHKKTHYKEEQYEQFFQELLKISVNSGNTL